MLIIFRWHPALHGLAQGVIAASAGLGYIPIVIPMEGTNVRGQAALREALFHHRRSWTTAPKKGVQLAANKTPRKHESTKSRTQFVLFVSWASWVPLSDDVRLNDNRHGVSRA